LVGFLSEDVVWSVGERERRGRREEGQPAMTQMCDELHSNSFLRKEIDIFYLTGFLAKSLALTPDKSVRRSDDIVSSGGFVGRVCRFSRRRKKREREVV
jgi:hypothetical protein